CPPTREDAGNYVLSRSRWQAPGGSSGKSKSPMSAVWLHYKRLPSRTYLKNQGLWPKYCPP
ncbi:hypothetical protein HC761_00990, partial [bacterium]|nr:hypothetical protein [bacterium]